MSAVFFFLNWSTGDFKPVHASWKKTHQTPEFLLMNDFYDFLKKKLKKTKLDIHFKIGIVC